SGIGDALLRRTFAHAAKVGAANRALITFSFNTVSQGLYIRHGLYPRLPIYFFRANRAVLADRGRETSLRHIDITDTELDRQRLAEIDVSALGFSRAKHHGYLSRDANSRGVLLHAAGECIGYAYVNSGGHIGPVAVTDPGMMGAAFATALGLAG